MMYAQLQDMFVFSFEWFLKKLTYFGIISYFICPIIEVPIYLKVSFFLSISTLLKLFDRLQCYKLSNDKVVKVLLLSFPSFALLSYIVFVVSFPSFGKKQLPFFFFKYKSQFVVWSKLFIYVAAGRRLWSMVKVCHICLKCTGLYDNNPIKCSSGCFNMMYR